MRIMKEKKEKRSIKKNTTHFCYGFNAPGNTQDPLVNTWNNFADASFDTALITDVRDIFTAFSNDYACFFCGDESSES